jgi:hypothetical protein
MVPRLKKIKISSLISLNKNQKLLKKNNLSTNPPQNLNSNLPINTPHSSINLSALSSIKKALKKKQQSLTNKMKLILV